MRDVDTIDRELSLLATTRAALRDMGCRPPIRQVDELLDERAVAVRKGIGSDTKGG